jgi:5-methylcytosine-specific restriction endonuclease McrA
VADACTVCGAGPRTRRLFYTVSAAGRLDSKCIACRTRQRRARHAERRQAAQAGNLAEAAAWLERRVAQQREAAWRYQHKQRARSYGVPYELVDRIAVWEQSGGVCCLCDEDIAEGEAWTVDHLIPLALGGPHTLDNLAAVHRRCNARKRDRLRLTSELISVYSDIVARQVRHA